VRDARLATARILIVDDEPANVRLLERILEHAGYQNLVSTLDPRQVLPLFTEAQPDLILLDVHMPHLDGFAVLRQLEPRIAAAGYLPILILTSDVAAETKQRALTMGAKDFLTKPFEQTEVLLRIHNLLLTRFLYQDAQDQNRTLEARVAARTRELEEAQLEILQRLALAAEFRDDETGRHAQRVGLVAAAVAGALDLPAGEVELIRRAAPLHDVGKIGVPDAILRKPGPLTREEFEIMKTHTTVGVQILSGSRSPLLQMAEEIALTHHERWDGKGYAGLAGQTIPLVGRITALADAFDAMTHDRVYRKALPVQAALDEISAQRGQQFDPHAADALLAAEGDLRGIIAPESRRPQGERTS